MTRAAGPIRYEGRVPKTLRAFVERRCVGKVYEVAHSGGFATESGTAYDVGISPGWSVDYYGERLHTCIAPTVRETIALLRTLRRCECDDECRAAWTAREEE